MNFEDIVKNIDKVPEKIRWAIIGAICIVLLVLYYILVRLPAEEEYAKHQVERAKLEREHVEKQTIADDLKNWQEEVRKTEAELVEALKRLPENIGYDNLIVIVPNFAKKNNLDLDSFELLDEMPQNNYSEVPIELKIKGSFIGFAKFMQEIGEHPRIMRIKNFEASRNKSAASPEEQTIVEVNAELVTYRFNSSANAGSAIATGGK